jgi:hypothetical protein
LSKLKTLAKLAASSRLPPVDRGFYTRYGPVEVSISTTAPPSAT